MQPATQLCRDLQRGTVSAVDVMRETYRRIEALNPELNALVALLPEADALLLAEAADRVPHADRGPLHGLPMCPKDAVEVEGFATTWGFVPWAENFPKADDGLAARMRGAGALFIGRSNMPEFGLGSNTFNSLYGRTKNPYDLDRTPGGSSGGAAAALASGMLPFADGSDMGGSLRNPASFCNVVGFRPSMGRMPNNKGFGWFGRLGITGPMARTVADTALLFSVQAGPDANDPITLPEPGETYLDAIVPREDLSGLKIGFAPKLHGIAIDGEVMTVMQAAADQCANLGADIIELGPNLSEAMQVFHVQRAAGLATLGDSLDRTIPDWKDHAKETAIWNIEKGQTLTSQEILDSELTRNRIYAETVRYFSEVDALLLPAAQVPPFLSDIEWIEEIEGQKMNTYIDWMEICCAITVTGCPAISVPGGFTTSGLPVGLQIVGPPRADLGVLKIAHTFEAATEHYKTAPALSAF